MPLAPHTAEDTLMSAQWGERQLLPRAQDRSLQASPLRHLPWELRGLGRGGVFGARLGAGVPQGQGKQRTKLLGPTRSPRLCP